MTQMFCELCVPTEDPHTGTRFWLQLSASEWLDLMTKEGHSGFQGLGSHLKVTMPTQVHDPSPFLVLIG